MSKSLNKRELTNHCYCNPIKKVIDFSIKFLVSIYRGSLIIRTHCTSAGLIDGLVVGHSSVLSASDGLSPKKLSPGRSRALKFELEPRPFKQV